MKWEYFHPKLHLFERFFFRPIFYDSIIGCAAEILLPKVDYPEMIEFFYTVSTFIALYQMNIISEKCKKTLMHKALWKWAKTYISCHFSSQPWCCHGSRLIDPYLIGNLPTIVKVDVKMLTKKELDDHRRVRPNLHFKCSPFSNPVVLTVLCGPLFCMTYMTVNSALKSLSETLAYVLTVKTSYDSGLWPPCMLYKTKSAWKQRWNLGTVLFLKS